MRFQSIMDFLERFNSNFVVLLCHHNADPDAICSAYTFSQVLRKIKPDLKIEIAAQGLSKLSKQILGTLPIDVNMSPRIEEAEVIFLIDTSTLKQLDDWMKRIENTGKKLILIDHHPLHPQTKNQAALCIIDDKASSTCEIIFELSKEAKVRLNRIEAQALFLGIIFDTKHFTIANSNTFKVAAELVNCGASAEEALSTLSLPMTSSERIARLKAANRLRIYRIGKWLLTVSHTGSYQASAARGLLSLGTHVAVVGGIKKGILRISMRSSNEFYITTGIHLGNDIAKPLGNHVQGIGGGHSTSAGFNGEGDLEVALRECFKLIKKSLKN
ncbi:MAG: hypothetical protein QG670_228 [Thermoproteota archaeon]|nr:hypothetical protein [Thermoproteota archaeon]